jgi:hypothetical protein
MRKEVELSVRTCLVCQQNKVEQRKMARMLQLLPVPNRPWAPSSMDFLDGFLTVEGMMVVMVIVDRFSKYAAFIAIPGSCSTKLATKLFFANVVKICGLPEDIVSDRDPRFTRRFWTALFNMMQFDLKFHTGYHP